MIEILTECQLLPPSPVLDLAPMRFMAVARVVWASLEMDPKLMAPVKLLVRHFQNV